MVVRENILESLRLFFAHCKEIELALLIGSRITGDVHNGSDWDFAIQWRRDVSWLEILEKTEILRAELAGFLQITLDKIDLINIPTARLAMRAVIAEEGVALKGDNTLSLSHFLLRTWGDLEDFYWNTRHAA